MFTHLDRLLFNLVAPPPNTGPWVSASSLAAASSEMQCLFGAGSDSRSCLSSTKGPLSWGKGGPSCLGKIESVPFMGPLGPCPSQSLAFPTPIQTGATAYFTHLLFMFF